VRECIFVSFYGMVQPAVAKIGFTDFADIYFETGDRATSRPEGIAKLLRPLGSPRLRRGRFDPRRGGKRAVDFVDRAARTAVMQKCRRATASADLPYCTLDCEARQVSVFPLCGLFCHVNVSRWFRAGFPLPQKHENKPP